MKNVINPLNPYLIVYNLWKKQCNDWTKDYAARIGKLHSAKELRSLNINLGRRTGKTEFALHLLFSSPNNCVLVCPNHRMRAYTFDTYRKNYSIPKISKDFKGIINANGFIESEEDFNQYSGYRGRDKRDPIDYDLRSVDLIIIDEPAMFTSRSIYNLWENAHSEAKFIFLGAPRL